MTTTDAELPGENIATTEKDTTAPPTPTPTTPTIRGRSRGAMSARIGAEDQTARRRDVEDAATHATATGKRRDLLSYLRLRRRKA